MKRRGQGSDFPAANSAVRAALYMRVSTNRQVEHNLSVPDQRAQLTSWCKAKQWEIGAEFIEPGPTATDDKRRVFQQMIERACDGEQAFDVIVVHSYSRFFRDAFGQEFYLRKLAKHGVKLVSITQPLGDEDDPAQAMMRKVIALFDKYQSKENAKHVIRSMKENARQGFWNGATCPLGYPCKGRSMPMGKLDSLVANRLVEHLFHPGRLAAILSSLTARRAEKAQSLNGRILELRREVTEAEDKLKRLYRLIEEGVTDLDDVLKDRLSNIKAERDRAKAALERANSHAVPITQIDPARIERFGSLMRHNLTNGSVPFRKAYLRSIIDIVEVDDTRVRIKGCKDALERAVLANPLGEDLGSQMSTTWRAPGDSNLWMSAL